MNKATDLVKRILSSQKVAYGVLLPSLANSVLAVAGVDITSQAVLVLDAGFAALFVAQMLLDLRWGSPSDGTGAFGK